MVRYDSIAPDEFKVFIKSILTEPGYDVYFEFGMDKIIAAYISSDNACASHSIIKVRSDSDRSIVKKVDIETLKKLLTLIKEPVFIEYDDQRNELTVVWGKFRYTRKVEDVEKIPGIGRTFKTISENIIVQSEIRKEHIKELLSKKADYVVINAEKDIMTISTKSRFDDRTIREMAIIAYVKEPVKVAYDYNYFSKIVDFDVDAINININRNKVLYCKFNYKNVTSQFALAHLEGVKVDKEEIKETKKEEENIIERISFKLNKNVYDAIKYIKEEFRDKGFRVTLLLDSLNAYIIGMDTSKETYSIIKLKANRELFDTAEFIIDYFIDDIIDEFKGIKKDEIYEPVIIRKRKVFEGTVYESIVLEGKNVEDFKIKEAHSKLIIEYLIIFDLIELGATDISKLLPTEELTIKVFGDGTHIINKEGVRVVFKGKYLKYYNELKFYPREKFKLPKGKCVVKVNENVVKPCLVLEYDGLNIMFRSSVAIKSEMIKVEGKFYIIRPEGVDVDEKAIFNEVTEMIKSGKKVDEIIKEIRSKYNVEVEDESLRNYYQYVIADDIVFKVIESININKNREATIREIYDRCSVNLISKQICAIKLRELEEAGKIYKLPLGYVTSEFYYEMSYNKLIKELRDRGVYIGNIKEAGIDLESEFKQFFEKFKQSPSLLEEQITVFASDIANRVKERLKLRKIEKEETKVVEVGKVKEIEKIVELRNIIKKAVEDSYKLRTEEAYKLIKQYNDQAKELFSLVTESDFESLKVLYAYKAIALPLSALYKDKDLEWVRKIPSII